MIKNLAIFSPGNKTFSETFIQAHKKLPFNIRFYYDGYLPTKLEGAENLIQFNFLQKFERKFKPTYTLQEFALFNSLRKEKIDFILAEYGPTASATLKLAQHLKIPMLVHFHGYDASINSVLAEYKKAYKAVFNYATTVVAVSNKMKKTLIEIGCPIEKLVVSVYGPDTSFFDIQPNYNTQQFIAVGRFVEKKAPDLTIQAFKKVVSKFPNATLVMVGDGELLANCKKIISALNIEKSVILKGIQTATEIKTLMEDSIAFVQHSVTATNGDSEGTPVAVLEAQAAALPVITTNHAGIPDVVINNETGLLVEEYDVDGMAKNMIKILQQDNLAKKLGKAGRNRISENFTQEKYLNSLEKEIKKNSTSLNKSNF